MKQTKPVSIMVAAFESETNKNHICLGEGFTKTEAIIRAVNLNFTDEELKNIISVYGTDEGGLMEWYEERGIYLSEPLILFDDKKNDKNKNTI